MRLYQGEEEEEEEICVCMYVCMCVGGVEGREGGCKCTCLINLRFSLESRNVERFEKRLTIVTIISLRLSGLRLFLFIR